LHFAHNNFAGNKEFVYLFFRKSFENCI
jgi:hypothetical protein